MDTVKELVREKIGPYYSTLASRFYPSPFDIVEMLIRKAGAPGVDKWARNRVVSYPKCGRTWLRVLIGKVLQEVYRFPEQEIINSGKLTVFHPNIPSIVFEHEDRPHFKKPDQLSEKKEKYYSKDVIFLIRDPRDVVVSSFHHETKRRLPEKDRFQGTIGEFLRREKGGFRSIVRYYNIWLKESKKIDNFLLLRYEDLQDDTEGELKKVLSLINFEDFTEDTVATAVKYAEFDHMKKMEKEQKFERIILQPRDKTNTNTYKTRKGKIGGFREELQEEDISYLNAILRDELTDSLAYPD